MLRSNLTSTLGKVTISKTQNGLAHFNINLESKQEFTRLLHPAWRFPFTHPVYGTFQCLDAFRWYLQSGCTQEIFREKYGHAMAQHGRARKRESIQDEVGVLSEAFKLQLAQNSRLKEAFDEAVEKTVEEGKPITFYSVYGNNARDLNVISTPIVDVLTRVIQNQA